MELLVKVADDRVDAVLELLGKLNFVEVKILQDKAISQPDQKTFLTVDVVQNDYQLNRNDLNER